MRDLIRQWTARFDLAVLWTAGGLLSAMSAVHFSSRQHGDDILSDSVSWLVLPLIFHVTSKYDILSLHGRGARTAASQSGNGSINLEPPVTAQNGNLAAKSDGASTWFMMLSFAFGVAVTSFGRGLPNSEWLLPALMPVVLIIEGFLDPGSTLPDFYSFRPLVSSLWGTWSIAIFTVFTLLHWDAPASAWSLVSIVGIILCFLTLLPKSSGRFSGLGRINVASVINPLSAEVLGFLAVSIVFQTFTIGTPSLRFHAIAAGCAEAFTWFILIHVVQSTSWRIAITIGTFSILATRDLPYENSEFHAISIVLASLFALSQCIGMLPKQANGRFLLFAFGLIPLYFYVANIRDIRAAQMATISSKHPVEELRVVGNARFEALVETQSKDYVSAFAAYKQKYSIDPPPGFEAWYRFAALHKSPIIDDYDSLHKIIGPLLHLSGKEVSELMRKGQNVDSDTWLCKFTSTTKVTECQHPRRSFDRHFADMFNRLAGNLSNVPDVRFLVNHLDEPTVLTPPIALVQTDFAGHTVITQSLMSREPTWGVLTKFCANKSTLEDSSTPSLPFVTDIRSSTNLCGHPEYSHLHGVFIHPTSFRLTEGLMPILSVGSLSTMSDLLIPSPAYFEDDFFYDKVNDVDWEKKSNKLYWAGSTSGGFASDENWRRYHRQRFVEIAQNLKPKHGYLRETADGISRIESSFLNGRLFDVAFTRIFQCSNQPCWNQRSYFKTRRWAHRDDPLKSRLVFDIDGNGISGRFYKLLASKSVPLKQTLFHEWHDDRLIPWVHYIPVSLSMEELPELVNYLTLTEPGQALAKEIAEQGRDWFSKAFREVDMSIYIYRVFLELARLEDPARPALEGEKR